MNSIFTSGMVNIEIKRASGEVETLEVKNLVVAAGKAYIASRVAGSGTAMTHMGLGSNDSASTEGMTSLQTQLARVALDEAVSANNNVVSFKATFPAGTATGSLTEAGIFSASTAGTMLCRTVFPLITKNAADSVTIRWNLTIG